MPYFLSTQLLGGSVNKALIRNVVSYASSIIFDDTRIKG